MKESRRIRDNLTKTEKILDNPKDTKETRRPKKPKEQKKLKKTRNFKKSSGESDRI